MERKLVRQGNERNRSFTTTLPREWVRNNQLDETLRINLDVVDNKIVIAPAKTKDEKVILNATNIAFLIKKIIAEKYKLGINEIEIKFRNICTLDLIREVVEKELIGFEIFEQTKTRCVIRDVAKDEVEAFEKVFERSLHTLSNISDEIICAIKEDDREYLKRVIEKDKDLNKLIFFCERQLNKRSQIYHGKIQFYFFLLERIENIGDTQKGIAKIYLDEKVGMSKGTLSVLVELNKRIKEFNQILFSKEFDHLRIKEFFDNIQKTRSEVIGLLNKKNNDLKYLYYLSSMIQYLKGAIRATYTLK